MLLKLNKVYVNMYFFYCFTNSSTISKFIHARCTVIYQLKVEIFFLKAGLSKCCRGPWTFWSWWPYWPSGILEVVRTLPIRLGSVPFKLYTTHLPVQCDLSSISWWHTIYLGIDSRNFDYLTKYLGAGSLSWGCTRGDGRCQTYEILIKQTSGSLDKKVTFPHYFPQ